jgi:hypothetical protein
MYLDNVTLVLGPLGERGDAMRAQEPFLIQHPCEHALDLLFSEDREHPPVRQTFAIDGVYVGDEGRPPFPKALHTFITAGCFSAKLLE